MIDDCQAIAERVGLIHIVSGQYDGFAELVVAAHDLPQHQARLRIEPRAGLVEKEHFGIVHHGAGDGDALHSELRRSRSRVLWPK